VISAARRVRAAWRQSLMLRVTSATLALSIIVVALLGFLLLSRVTSGLLDSTQRSALVEASAGLTDARRVLSAANTGGTPVSASTLVDSVITALAARAGSPGQFDVLLLSNKTTYLAPERGTNLVSVGSVPVDLRDSVAGSDRQSWTYTEIRYLDGRTAPGLVVGAPLNVPTVAPYELYYLFPLTQQQQTLDLVRSAVVGTAVLLVLLVALIVWLVTRQVVAPVRTAARIAERFASGHLEERVVVRGEDDLARMATAFNDMAASIEAQIHQLENLSLVQQRFVSDVSHELRTPLTTVRMAADVLFESRATFDPATARAAELLSTQIDRFEILLADLLEISRYDAGAAALEIDATDLVALVRRVIDSAEPLARRREIEVRLVPHLDVCMVDCDARRIERVVRNLIGNAIEHAEGKPVLVGVGADGLAAAVTVRDHGVGLSEEDLPHVFDRFWRADPARARTTGGTGLGLSIALEDARLHGGWLEAWGEPGAGASFRLTIPCRAGDVLVDSPLPLDGAVVEVGEGVIA
jgi:two-component system sensor histidine kinase MtrB